MSQASQISKEAQVEVLEHELAEVRWLAKHAADDERKAAASLRVLRLQQEIDEVRSAA